MQRVVLIGCGFMGTMHGTVYSKLDNASLVAVVDSSADRADAFASEFGCRGFASLGEALSALEAEVVDVCLPTDLHLQVVLEAASYGKDIFCEKPMARTVDQAVE